MRECGCNNNNYENNYRVSGRRDSRPLAMAYVRKQSWRRIYKPDVAFVDIDLGGESGLDCAKLLTELHIVKIHITVFALKVTKFFRNFRNL